MGWFKRLIKRLGVQIQKDKVVIVWRSEKPFDPYYQKRTTPNEDFNKAKEEETNKMIDKISNKEDTNEDT